MARFGQGTQRSTAFMGRLLIGRWLVATAMATAMAAAWTDVRAQAQRVSVPSLDRDAQGGPVMLLGHWSPSSGPVGDAGAPKPARGAMLLLHGCSGPYDASGRLGSRMVTYTEQLNRRGWSVLVLDSFTTRGERELCTQPLNGRRITQAHRRLDAWGALAWLAAQPGVDPARLGLLGWSNGGSTVLATIDAQRLARRPAEVPLPAFAVAYYPGCAEALQGGVRAGVPVLLQLGQADDWTPAYTCENWAQQASLSRPTDAMPVGGGGDGSAGANGEASGAASGAASAAVSPSGPRVEVVLYPGAHHGFDGEGPVRLRRDVPNGVNRGQGVHVGGDPKARRESLLRLEQWLMRYE